jgi:hypothetical protein
MNYSEFKPTVFDNHIDIPEREHWLVVPVSRNRDSGPFSASNFSVAASMFGIENIDDPTIDIPGVEIHRFGHWASGWFEILIVAPTEANENKVEEIEATLANYPILDDQDLNEREMELVRELWDDLDGDEKAQWRYRDYTEYGVLPMVGVPSETFEENARNYMY